MANECGVRLPASVTTLGDGASTFPGVLPFVLIVDAGLARRVSAAVAIAMRCICGDVWGRYAGLEAGRTGAVMALLGAAIESVVIALGGWPCRSASARWPRVR